MLSDSTVTGCFVTVFNQVRNFTAATLFPSIVFVNKLRVNIKAFGCQKN